MVWPDPLLRRPPSRDVGATPTERFLAGLGFQDDNPPNAAIVVDDGNGGTDIAVVELRNPLIDPTVPAVIYDVTVLANWEDTTELGLQEGPADLSDLPASFGPTHLFIDDCANGTVSCYDSDGSYQGVTGQMGFCHNYAICMPCEPYFHTQPGPCSTRDYWTDRCNHDPIGGCNGLCYADFVGNTLVCNGFTD